MLRERYLSVWHVLARGKEITVRRVRGGGGGIGMFNVCVRAHGWLTLHRTGGNDGRRAGDGRAVRGEHGRRR